MFWARAGLGAPSAPDFWKTLHDGDLTVYRTEIKSLSHTDVVNLKNGTSVQSDMIIACTGFEKPYRPFSRELREELGLAYDKRDADKWAKLNAAAEAKVDELLPMLKGNTPPSNDVETRSDAVLHGPNRHYRRLIPLKLAAANDRSIIFPGLVHVIFTPTISEFQALWGAAYMLRMLQVPSLDVMEIEVATFNTWGQKRHLEMGQKHSYCIFDYLSVGEFSIPITLSILMSLAVYRHTCSGSGDQNCQEEQPILRDVCAVQAKRLPRIDERVSDGADGKAEGFYLATSVR